MSKTVRLTSDSLNSYGTRVLTAGMDIEQYMRNPVLLDMHERGNVIGYVQNIERKDGEIVGELVFDEASDLSKQRKMQWEKGSLRMVSVGLDILEMSDAPEHIVLGQTRPTITKSRLFEVSLVDIGANDDAIVLRKDNKIMTLSADGSCPLPSLNTLQMTKNTENTVEALQERIATMTAEHNAEVARLTAEINAATERADKAEAALVAGAVEDAVSSGRILASSKDHFTALGKKIGLDELRATLGAMTPRTKISENIGTKGTAYTAKDWDEADRKGTLAKIKNDEPEKFAEMFKARFGKDYK